MAPPRGAMALPPKGVLKKSTVKETAKRQSTNRGSRHRRIIDQDSDEVEAHVDNIMVETHSSSMGSPGSPIEALMAQMKRDRNNRKIIQRKNLRKTHEARVKKTRADITTFFDNHDKELTQVRQTHLARLKELLARKTELEAKMSGCVKRLQDGYIAHSKDLQLVLDARSAQLLG